MNYFSLTWLRVLLRAALNKVRGTPALPIELDIPGLQLVHVCWRCYWLRVDLQAISSAHQKTVESVPAKTAQTYEHMIEGRDFFIRRSQP